MSFQNVLSFPFGRVAPLASLDRARSKLCNQKVIFKFGLKLLSFSYVHWTESIAPAVAENEFAKVLSPRGVPFGVDYILPR